MEKYKRLRENRLPPKKIHSDFFLPLSANMLLKDPLVWVDCEMTGLGSEHHRLLEIAVIVTDGSLEQVIRGPEFIIHQPAEVLDQMNEWCKNQFGWRNAGNFDEGNLAAKSLKSLVTEAEAERQILDFLTPIVPEKKGVLAGNSVHADKAFLDKFMPKFMAYLHYRIVDVSTIKELGFRWKPEIMQGLKKKGKHRAMEDIKESIAELLLYKAEFFKS